LKYPAELISRLAPGLIVDVGAATGETTRLARNANPASRVIAFEPFPGNLRFLEESVAGDPMVTVRPVAASDYQGSGKLFLPSIIQGNGRRAALAGSSRVGKLNPFPLRIGREIHEHVRFLKVDVQVGEFNLLKGCRDLIARHGTDLIYVEFRRDLRLPRLLRRSGYTIFDSAYMAWPHRRYFRNVFRAKSDWSGRKYCSVLSRLTVRGFTSNGFL
jgi:FkbM family methyltransferase